MKRDTRITCRILGAAVLGALGLGFPARDAHAQIAGVTQRPLPNVLLLVDTSGSMERMPDSSLPSQNRDPISGGTIATAPFNACTPGSPTNPNRWGMLLQALTGNFQPYYSCDAVNRAASNAAFKNEFKINGVVPYDTDYVIPYHRPISGGTAAAACALTPAVLPGAAPGTGVGPTGGGRVTDPSTGGTVTSRDMPDDAFAAVLNTPLRTAYNGNTSPITALNACTFEQANDGQLDATRDFIRFAMMTFDNDTSPGIGVMSASPVGGTVNTVNPFLGQWSYVKSPTNPLSLGAGFPAGCVTGAQQFEVGARHMAAPPWEGRMVNFPAPFATLTDMKVVNDRIQKVLLGARPYGATPIDGMMEDARDFLWYNDEGPNGIAPYADPYVTSACRPQYVVLLTDGAPNLDMRPSCEGTGQCPYPNKAAEVAQQMRNAAGNRNVTTFVIGFSVNGSGNVSFTNDGFPAAYAAPQNNCKAWYNGVGGTSTDMRSACTSVPGGWPAKGSTADACCQLNEIAYYGSAGTAGPFFAETQADLVLSFGRILGNIARAASTRTVPGYAPAVSVSGASGSGQVRTAEFVASFIPNAQKVWSGEIDRTRSYCVGAVPTPQNPQSVTQGDSYAANTAAQSVAGQRLFISAKAALNAGFIDSQRTLRPYASATSYTDSMPDYPATEVAALDMGLVSQSNWPEALEIDDNTCKRSRAPVPGAPTVTATVPRLGKADCTDVVWGFTTAHHTSRAPSLVKGSPAFDFNVRCRGSGGASTGFCSISGGGCAVGSSCPIPGEVCVPECAALGAVFRSSPTVIGPPSGLVRDDGYRTFAEQRSKRRPTMFVATSDGVLHAYKALAAQDFDPGDYEMWAFVPPAVLPKLASNYPTGQQILLDGTPVVKDVVWERRTADVSDPTMWKSTLVAGLGSGGPGYYALNVTDVDCGGTTNSGACLAAGRYAAATSLAQAATAAGPHFLWQMTDIESIGAGEIGKPVRTSRDGKQFVSLFGRESATPAITTIQADPDGNGVRQIGVAILPGGIDGSPVTNGFCPRALNGGGYTPADFDFSDATLGARRNAVRQWGTTCASPVPGRGITIVRLDTGEILRHFGRKNQDVPSRLSTLTTDSPFDSPVIGTPAVFPVAVGAPAQKVFVGDADGTVWRLDVTSTNPANWKVSLFQDLLAGAAGTNAAQAAASQPIQIPLTLSVDPAGNLVVNAATGDQESIVISTDTNYVISVREGRPPTTTTQGRAEILWRRALTNGQRVTGPMVVFDRVLYFASFEPSNPSSATCTEPGTPYLWGMDFVTPSTSGITAGGFPRWCPIGQVDAVTGACKTATVDRENPTSVYPSLKGSIIPGVTLRASQSCADFSGTSGDPAITSMSSTKFELFFGSTGSRSSGGSGLGTPQVERTSILRPLPRTTARIDAWAFVVD